jgi:hypothetical protein
MANLTGKVRTRREPERQHFVIRFLSSDDWSGSWSGIPWEGRTAQATMGRMHTSIAAVRIRGSPDVSAFPTLHRFKRSTFPWFLVGITSRTLFGT